MRATLPVANSLLLFIAGITSALAIVERPIEISSLAPHFPTLGVLMAASSAALLLRKKRMPFLSGRSTHGSAFPQGPRPVEDLPGHSNRTPPDPEALVSIRAVPLHLRDRQPDEWDSFAQECNASFQSSHGWLWGWSLKMSFRRHLQLFEFYRAGDKVGQCAVGIGGRERIFLDGLALKPGCETLWTDCMEALLTCVGPGTYRYGWQLSLEKAREEELGRLPGLTIESVRPLTVQAVDLAKWSTWDEFWASTSSNTRRNAKRAEKAALKISVQTALGCLLLVRPIFHLRSVMYERKGIQFSRLHALASFIGGHLFAPKYRLAAVVTEGNQALAGFIGLEFGNNTYYVAGGSLANNNGAAWFLQKEMLRRTWERSSGRAKFILGHVDYAIHDEGVGGGLLRSRRSINATDFETSIVVFEYRKSRTVHPAS